MALLSSPPSVLLLLQREEQSGLECSEGMGAVQQQQSMHRTGNLTV